MQEEQEAAKKQRNKTLKKLDITKHVKKSMKGNMAFNHMFMSLVSQKVDKKATKVKFIREHRERIAGTTMSNSRPIETEPVSDELDELDDEIDENYFEQQSKTFHD